MTNRQRIKFLLLILLFELTLALFIGIARFHQIIVRPAPSKPRRAKLVPTAEEKFTTLKKYVFTDEASLKSWDEKVFRGRSHYQVLSENGRTFLAGSSRGESSALFMKVDLPLEPGFLLSWRWRAVAFPKKAHPERLADHSQDDFAARIYAVFPGSGFFNTNVIEYIWDEHLPPGTAASSPFSGKVKLVVVRSGAGDWQTETRDLYRDYITFFGQKPDRPLGAIAFMTDSDNTHTQSMADFGEFTIKIKNKMPVIDSDALPHLPGGSPS